MDAKEKLFFLTLVMCEFGDVRHDGIHGNAYETAKQGYQADRQICRGVLRRQAWRGGEGDVFTSSRSWGAPALPRVLGLHAVRRRQTDQVSTGSGEADLQTLQSPLLQQG